MNIRISEASKRLGVHPSTLRNLEKRGTITVQRDWAGWRIFSEEELMNIQSSLFNRRGGSDGTTMA
jgi:DNA-binding transcriptional MerR regulator